MKFSSRTALIQFVTYTLVALIWFFSARNTIIGIIWICVAVAEFVISLVCRKNERKK